MCAILFGFISSKPEFDGFIYYSQFMYEINFVRFIVILIYFMLEI